MAGKPERDVAREVVSEYHAAALRALFSPVTEAIDRMTRGEIDPFEADAVIFQYSRAAKALWKYCNDDVYFVADTIRAGHAPPEWWSRGAFQRR